MSAAEPVTQTRFLIEGKPIVLQCKQCQTLLKEVMAQDRMMAELKRDLRSLELLINKKFGYKLNLRTTRNLRYRDRTFTTAEVRPVVQRQEKLKVGRSPRAKFARLRALRQKVKPGTDHRSRACEEHTNDNATTSEMEQTTNE